MFTLGVSQKIRKYIDTNASLKIYKNTILPIIEYADFIYDQRTKYGAQKLQSFQNRGLYIVFNQHFLNYLQKDSSESLHERAKIFRLVHRRRLHLLSYAFRLTGVEDLLDVRDIRTRQHEGLLFRLYKVNHYKCVRDPVYISMSCWNALNVETRNIRIKAVFVSSLKGQIENPYKKICN